MIGEITNSRIADKIGIKGNDQIMLVQNVNEFSSLEGHDPLKVLNLKLERLPLFTDLTDASLTSRHKKVFEGLSRAEIEDELMLSEDPSLNAYHQFMSLIEKVLDPLDILLAHTQKSLKFYQRYFKRDRKDVLFVSYGQPLDENAKQLLAKTNDFKQF